MVLQPKDLMVGDWVYIKDHPIKSQPQKVKPEHFVRSLVEFEPIPLTPEILSINFSSCPGWWFIGDSSVYFRIYKKEGKYLLCIRSKKVKKFRMTITYLHELQHALRLCKIEKTIELSK